MSISKTLFDVCKRTIVAKVKSFVYHIHTFQLDSCDYKEGTCLKPLWRSASVSTFRLFVEEILVFFGLELIFTIDITIFNSF